MSKHCNPTRKELEGWLDKKLQEFVVQENINPQISKERWLDRYIYMEIHEIFFASFLTELYEWFMRLDDSVGRCRFDKPIMWTREVVRRLEAFEDKIVRAVDHWLD